ncbi:hypothetical protein NIES4073_75440 [Kalymmatonema gypsitolerans NIES-4073]|nr:hypothetical protein NIES4073_75440 [Scytonema sp. NIES-4073]
MTVSANQSSTTSSSDRFTRLRELLIASRKSRGLQRFQLAPLFLSTP